MVHRLRHKVGPTTIQHRCGLSSVKRAHARARLGQLQSSLNMSGSSCTPHHNMIAAILLARAMQHHHCCQVGRKSIQVEQGYSDVRRCLNALAQGNGFRDPLVIIHKRVYCLNAATRQEHMARLCEALLCGVARMPRPLRARH